MNNKGLAIFYNLMLGLLIIVLGMALGDPIKQVIDEQMTSLTCSVPSSDTIQGLCWLMDLSKPLVTGGIIFIGFAVLLAYNAYQ